MVKWKLKLLEATVWNSEHTKSLPMFRILVKKGRKTLYRYDTIWRQEAEDLFNEVKDMEDYSDVIEFLSERANKV